MSDDSESTYELPAICAEPVPSSKLRLSWADVTYTVRVGKEERMLLRGVDGEAKGGEVVAILGGSGAGKSTLINVLSGRTGTHTVSGSILLNSQPRNAKTWPSVCAYTEQDDVLLDNLTVYETLMYSAKLRLPPSMSKEQKEQRVEEVLSDLGLSGCRDVKVGGVSGGERRRTSIGVDLLTHPQVLFLDEPTSGLDAYTAFFIVEMVKRLATAKDMIVIMSIHQPRTDILALFSKIMLLSMGQSLFYGATA
ncbi:hypothetical protein HK104_005573, partial [Borealophlyctis nickersoniae]